MILPLGGRVGERAGTALEKAQRAFSTKTLKNVVAKSRVRGDARGEIIARAPRRLTRRGFPLWRAT